MRKELSLGLALYALIIQTTPAAQPFQLYSCVDELYIIAKRCYDANEELEFREGRLRDIDEKIAAIDKEYPFLPKADSLRISEFEEEEDFKLRVKRQQEADEAQRREAISKRDSAKRKFEPKRREQADSVAFQANIVKQILAEYFAFTNKVWRRECKLSADDLPVFDRETLSFRNLPSPLVTHSDEEKKLRFDVLGGKDFVSLKFQRPTDAGVFKQGLASGALTMTFICTFTLGLPENCVIRKAWTETHLKEKSRNTQFMEKWGGIAILLAAGAAGVQPDPHIPVSAPSRYYEEKEHHPEIKGLCVPVHVRKCSVEIKGTKPKDLAKAKGMELSSTSGNWQLFFR